MSSEEIFSTALEYENKIRDFYLDAVQTIDDKRGKTFFEALAKDEQSHVDFLEDSLEKLAQKREISLDKLWSPLPFSGELVKDKIDKIKVTIPEKMLGDFKRILSAALKLEIKTSRYYREAYEKSDGSIKPVLEKFYEIEQNHVNLVQFELDQASRNGYWFDFMEIDMEY